MSIDDINNLIRLGEAIDREFKSDRSGLPDREIYEEIVAMANTSGGVLLVGVEDDGRVTGAKARHGATTDPLRLQSAIFNNTVPNISTCVSVVEHPNGSVIAIEVDSCPEICAISSGRVLRRTITSNGKPQSVPFYPHEQRSRRVDLGLIDFSAQLMEGTSFSDLNPLEFERMRQAIVGLRGDRSLLELSNEDMAKALRLVETYEGKLIPNIAGLLLLGRTEVLRSVIPTHEAHFQVLDRVGDVKVNDPFHEPLIYTLEAIEARFAARNEEQEVLVGMFRVPMPDYSPIGFREAVNNALLHRDYSQLGAVYVQWQHDLMLITNPGGFPFGVTADNILVHEPKPRNKLLAEAFKRVGLVEQTGRGVDKIFMGQLRYGRPAPDYSRSDSTGVRVVLHGGRASLQFTAMIFDLEKESSLTVDEVIVLNTLAQERRIDAETAGRLIQRDTSEGKSLLEGLNERGLIEAKGEKRGRVYHLSAQLYRRLGQPEAYVHSHGIDRLRREGLVMEYLAAHGRIDRSETARLLGITSVEARNLLLKMAASGKIIPQGPPRRGRYYVESLEQPHP